MQAFYKTEEYKAILDDRELLRYFYHETAKDTEGWTICYNKNQKLVKYKYEEGCSTVSCMNECIVNAPIMHVMCLFTEIDMFKEWFPQL